MNVCSLLVAVDQNQMELPKIEWRDALMKIFFEGLSPEGIRIISKDAENVCDWDGIKCESTAIRKIQFVVFYHGDFNISALPHTTTDISIHKCKQTFQIRTRSLPRNLNYLYLGDNKITGKIDLTTLPEQLENANFWGNRLTGPIELTNLPKSLTTLMLYANKIHQNTVFYDNLPDGIERIYLKGHTRSNSITEVRSVYPENTVKNKQIFSGIKQENVH